MPGDVETQSPTDDLMEMVVGGCTAQAIYTAAKLGIADVLAEGPRTAEEIAAKVEADPDGVYRLLRALTTRAIFAEEPGKRFTLTPMADALRSDAPNSVRALVLMAGHPITWETWGRLTHSVVTGEPAFWKLRGMRVFEYLARDEEYADLFNQAMTFSSSIEIPTILEAYDFSRFRTIVDVGGGQGRLLAAILQATPDANGVLLDIESVTASAPPVLAEAGVADRCTIHSGSFFDAVPTGGDAYILKHVLHDWPEDKAVDILRSVRASIGENGELLLVALVLPDDNSPHLGKVVDLDLLLEFGGRHRTAEEYRRLLATAGFALRRVVPTAGAASVVEAVPA
ncbi:methyltransferase [Streptomyces sclerotialus]|uniref:methyltransferase n=1 Tax=Streptomyces sclerotialus TaxID=1957 RepID=UPI000690D0E8